MTELSETLNRVRMRKEGAKGVGRALVIAVV
jgi:hypothetical protein